MVLWVINETRDTLHVLTEMQNSELREAELVHHALTLIEGLDNQSKSIPAKHVAFRPPLVPEDFQSATFQTMVPLAHEKRVFGVLIIACGEQCRCHGEEVDLLASMLTQAAGVIKRAILHEDEIRELQNRLESSLEFCGIVSKDPKMQLIFRLIEDIAPTDATVLIQGESGTGKELVARAIHQQSPRSDRPFIVIDCSAYPATLLESELFGHEKGAFTGATRQKSGRFEQAHGGTVFLDEIGEIPLSAQIKLLRVLQTQRFERLGGEKTLSVDVRILAATNKNLLEEVKKGQFREDLFYRLNVIPIHLPLLRDRRNDIPLLARHFLRRFALAHGKALESFTPEAMSLLLDHGWPGNVRELENTIEHAAVLAKGPRIDVSHLPASIRTGGASAHPTGSRTTIADHEIKLLQATMDQCEWNKKKAAHRLGISRSTLYEKLKRYRISPPTRH
jgi:two-component system response regulator HydG